MSLFTRTARLVILLAALAYLMTPADASAQRQGRQSGRQLGRGSSNYSGYSNTYQTTSKPVATTDSTTKKSSAQPVAPSVGAPSQQPSVSSGVNQSVFGHTNLQGMQVIKANNPSTPPVAPPIGAAPGPIGATAGPVIVKDAGSADLVLEDAKMAQDPTLLVGPAYAVRFRNQGLSAAGKFYVAAVTSNDGQLHEDAPKAMLEVTSLASGDSRNVVLRLPRGDFKYLILVLDTQGAVHELDKTNNSAIVEREAL